MKYVVIKNWCVATFLFFGGACCIILSINIKRNDMIVYDSNTTGTVSFVSPLALSFDYVYIDNIRNIVHAGIWTTVDPFVQNKSLMVAFSHDNPNCSQVINVQGASGIYCSSVYKSEWFWPILLVVGICSMCMGSVFGSKTLFYKK